MFFFFDINEVFVRIFTLFFLVQSYLIWMYKLDLNAYVVDGYSISMVGCGFLAKFELLSLCQFFLFCDILDVSFW